MLIDTKAQANRLKGKNQGPGRFSFAPARCSAMAHKRELGGLCAKLLFPGLHGAGFSANPFCHKYRSVPGFPFKILTIPPYRFKNTHKISIFVLSSFGNYIANKPPVTFK
jgi:hypothetical protein